ncbi:MAG: carbohydrate ABC transporter permease [bacterium]|nr:carbohydrate ABC transporter permease [bacterium]
MKRSKFARLSFADKSIFVMGYLLLAAFVLLIIVPLCYVIVASFMDPTTLSNQGLSFDFSKWTLMGYQRVLSNQMIWRGFGNAILYSVVFTFLSVFVTALAAYPLSKKDLVGKRFFNALFLVTMFFNGGLIPTYLVISNLEMLDTIWAIVLPNAFNVWNMILARTYYQSIPEELREASAVDGASDVLHFFKILLPVCKPIIAVLALYQFVALWNSYFDAMIYLNDANKQPLQLVLRSILIQNTPEAGMIADIQSRAEMAKLAELLKYSTIVVSSLPLLVMYPFFQKYFDQGLMVGSVKG